MYLINCHQRLLKCPIHYLKQKKMKLIKQKEKEAQAYTQMLQALPGDRGTRPGQMILWPKLNRTVLNYNLRPPMKSQVWSRIQESHWNWKSQDWCQENYWNWTSQSTNWDWGERTSIQEYFRRSSRNECLTYPKRVKLALPSNEEDVDEYFQDSRKGCWNFA